MKLPTFLFRPRLLTLFALTLLALAWTSLAIKTGTPWPWDALVHEDGNRTLGQTILYFEHGIRELFLDIFLGLAIASGFLYFRPLSSSTQPATRIKPNLLFLGFTADLILILTFMFIGALMMAGSAELIQNLFQMHI